MLRVRPEKVSQSLNPALVKIARLMRADPLRTLEALFAAMAELPELNDFDPPST